MGTRDHLAQQTSLISAWSKKALTLVDTLYKHSLSSLDFVCIGEMRRHVPSSSSRHNVLWFITRRNVSNRAIFMRKMNELQEIDGTQLHKNIDSSLFVYTSNLISMILHPNFSHLLRNPHLSHPSLPLLASVWQIIKGKNVK